MGADNKKDAKKDKYFMLIINIDFGNLMIFEKKFLKLNILKIKT